MAQTTEGARKVAARRLGLTLAEYEARQAGGLKHCTKCKDWKSIASFNMDKSRRDGLAAKCRRCNSGSSYPEDMTKSEKIKAAWIYRLPTFVPPMKGKRMSDESRRKMSQASKGKTGIRSNRFGKKHTPEARAKIADATKERTARGENHYAYSHGRAQRNLSDRRSVEYKHWRDAVYVRDGYTCRHCGDNRGGNLQAHHQKSFAGHPELRFDVDNGITLCKSCHEKVHLKPMPSKTDLRRRRKHIC